MAIVTATWEPVQRPLARLRVAIEQAEDELLCLRRAYAQVLERTASLAEFETVAFRAVPLSPQEQRIAILIAGGRTNLEIAGDLHVSVNTVKTQVKSILRKLDVRSRWQVAGALKTARPE